MNGLVSLYLVWLAVIGSQPEAEEVFLTMGFRVGEVAQTRAVVWTRLCATPERRRDGISEVGSPGPKTEEFVPPETEIAEREGSVPGRSGVVRIVYSTDPDLSNRLARSEWFPVRESEDFTHQFELTGLEPGRTYHLRIEGRAGAGGALTRSRSGSFTTAAPVDTPQDVLFTVVTGQMYKDLDHPDGYRIYPAMAGLEPQFIVLTGDTVYYDNELPRARTAELARYHWQRMYSLPRIVAFHRGVPGYWLKDDHDILADDTWPFQDPGWMKPMTFAEGQRIFKEAVPVGASPYRTVRWGKDLQIWFVEGRDFRSPNSDPDGPEKTIWGFEQREWLMKSILDSDASFRVLISPTPIIGPDRENKRDNHANSAFAYEGDLFRSWTKEEDLSNFFVICGDRHWQYVSVDPRTGLRELSCGPVSDEHAGGSPGLDPEYHRFHRVGGGFLSTSVSRPAGLPEITFRLHDVEGREVFSYRP